MPYKSPTAVNTQRRAYDALLEHAGRVSALERERTQLVRAGRLAGVPDTRIAIALGMSRTTFWRRFGPDTVVREFAAAATVVPAPRAAQ